MDPVEMTVRCQRCAVLEAIVAGWALPVPRLSDRSGHLPAGNAAARQRPHPECVAHSHERICLRAGRMCAVRRIRWAGVRRSVPGHCRRRSGCARRSWREERPNRRNGELERFPRTKPAVFLINLWRRTDKRAVFGI